MTLSLFNNKQQQQRVELEYQSALLSFPVPGWDGDDSYPF